MSIVKEKYSPNRVNLIHQILVSEADVGKPKEYDIRIDELKVVSRTADPERFFTHEDFVQADTRSITVCLYDGASRRCTRYVLLLREEDTKHKSALAGIENTITEKLAQEKSRWQYEQVLKENEALKAQLEEAEEYGDELEQRIQQMEAEKNTSTNRITETLVGLAGAYISKNPDALNGIPLLGALAGSGTAASATQTTSQTHGEEYGASFSKVERRGAERQDGVPQGPPTIENREELRRALLPFFTDEQIPKVEGVMAHFVASPNTIDEVLYLFQQASLANGTFSQGIEGGEREEGADDEEGIGNDGPQPNRSGAANSLTQGEVAAMNF